MDGADGRQLEPISMPMRFGSSIGCSQQSCLDSAF
jgi:hypothetical protein